MLARRSCRVHMSRQRVEIGEEVEALGLVLHPHPAQDRAEQIAEMEVAGRLDAGNDAHVQSFVMLPRRAA